MRSRGTGLEREMEKILKSLRLRYERQPDLVGHPDFRVTGTRTLIFCDSSFWHGRRDKDLTGESFSRNRGFWTQKIAYNKSRDARITKQLKAAGWTVLRFWDTEIMKGSKSVTRRITKHTSRSARP